MEIVHTRALVEANKPAAGECKRAQAPHQCWHAQAVPMLGGAVDRQVTHRL